MDQELKQRLIGASVIIALAIIFVPMLFDGEVNNQQNENISISIPDAADSNLEVKKFELDQPVTAVKDLPPADTELVIENEQPKLVDVESANPAVTDPMAIPTESAADTVNKDDVVAEVNEVTSATDQTDVENNATETNEPTATSQQVQTEVKPKPVKSPNNTANTTPATGGMTQAYRVKLGSFSQPANAEKVKNSLMQSNIKAIVEFNPGLKLYRVWSQELYRDESSAQQYVSAVNQLKLNIGTPKVVTLAADEVSQMASQQALGWVVQLGSFSDKNNALDLRNKVKAAGFNGFVDEITTAAGATLYRLRIGPLMEKSDAEATQIKIKNQLKLDGLVKSHDLGRIVN